METISFSSLFSTLQLLFFDPLFFTFPQQFTAGENLKVAGDSAGRRRILTTPIIIIIIIIVIVRTKKPKVVCIPK